MNEQEEIAAMAAARDKWGVPPPAPFEIGETPYTAPVWEIADALARNAAALQAAPGNRQKENSKMEARAPILHNYTPHEIAIDLPDGTRVQYASEGVARVGQVPGPQIASLDGVPVYGPSVYGAVEGLPLEAPTHYNIVSLMVAQALPDRADLLVPGTGPADGAIREKGLVVAVTRLISLAGVSIRWQTEDGLPICPQCAEITQVHVDPDGFHVCMRCGHGWHIPALAAVPA